MGDGGKLLLRLDGGFMHWCPGCETHHYIAVETPLKNGARWDFDGDLARPSFSPSVRHRIPAHPETGDPEQVCHYFITKGRILFCADSTHRLAGLTVELPAWSTADAP